MTALTIFTLATAVALIGGLAVIPTTMQSVSAGAGSGDHECFEVIGGEACASGGGGGSSKPNG